MYMRKQFYQTALGKLFWLETTKMPIAAVKNYYVIRYNFRRTLPFVNAADRDPHAERSTTRTRPFDRSLHHGGGGGGRPACPQQQQQRQRERQKRCIGGAAKMATRGVVSAACWRAVDVRRSPLILLTTALVVLTGEWPI